LKVSSLKKGKEINPRDHGQEERKRQEQIVENVRGGAAEISTASSRVGRRGQAQETTTHKYIHEGSSDHLSCPDQYCADFWVFFLLTSRFSFYRAHFASFFGSILILSPLPPSSFQEQNKLKKEDAFTRLNVSKIKSEWRDILRKIKCRELQEDLKAIKKECDESIQRKNSVIRRLLSDLDESEEIYSAMLHSHMNIIGKLIGEARDDAWIFSRSHSDLLQAFPTIDLTFSARTTRRRSVKSSMPTRKT
jgi:Sperm tail